MKKILLMFVLAVLSAGCFSANKKSAQEDGLTDQYAKYQIVDQEFDHLIVDNDHYDRVSSYEDQVSGSSYIQSSTRKAGQRPARTMKVKKTVVDGAGNPMPAEMSAPVADQEILPEENEESAY